jgi:hypothetical protein
MKSNYHETQKTLMFG